ncbi:MAG: type II toxin-antitoxin system HipA family toxin [Schwartzia sp.]|nr:type II toxin-antitoxin system HipA family toxin [Schwartzia sp. (in: firmicutes)]
MEKTERLRVYYKRRKVGTLALHQKALAAFAYEKEWLAEGFSISPFSLPLRQQVFIPKPEPFGGIFGVFADSLPDGWGRLLVDRMLARNRIDPGGVGNLDRLAIVGKSGMGALTYTPEIKLERKESAPDLDRIAADCAAVLRTGRADDLDELFRLGGSSGGARPKILTKVDGEDWIVKFPSASDGKEIGLQEYEYSLCAKACGIEMAETRLFPSACCAGYFGTRRFDRRQGDKEAERVHMVSVSGLLETSHRIPNLDYDLLMKLTLELTRSYTEIEKLYRLMCFNVFAHNRDDHSRNFSFLYEEKQGGWRLAPAYDLTFSYSLGGEHATSVHGNGATPELGDLLAVAGEIGLDLKKAKRIAKDVRECVHERLRKYLKAQFGGTGYEFGKKPEA